MALAGFLNAALVFWHIDDFFMNPNITSRLATVDALVHHGTYAIDNSLFNNWTVDKARINGRFYSTKPFMLSTLMAAAYGTFHRITKQSFSNALQESIYRIKIVAGFIPHLLSLVYFYCFLVLWAARPMAAFVTFVCFLFGSLANGYAATINNHSPAAALTLMTFYHAYRIRSKRSMETRDWLLSGFFGGFLATIDHPSLLFGLAVLFYLGFIDTKKTAVYFVPAAMVPIAAHFYINYMATGSLWPVEMRREAFLYPGSYWLHPVANDALDEPKWTYLFHLSLGHHGFFAMTPLFIFSLISMAVALRSRERKAPEALVTGSVFLLFVIFYVVFTSNYGGNCVGVRWFLPLTPLLFLFLTPWLEKKHSMAAWALFLLAFLVSACNSYDALKGPWRDSIWDGVVKRHLRM